IALALEPKLVVMDEPTTALDVVVQRQILQEIDAVRKRLGISIIFITHDLRVAAQISDYITVMEKGVMVEFGTAEDVFNAPQHEYTKMLLDAAPGRDWHPPRLSREEATRIANEIQRN
ncbi:MAG: microcin ABC transporter ATP-binding protein, partial [Pseudomonadota bacterium]